jgi:hypothetical protein
MQGAHTAVQGIVAGRTCQTFTQARTRELAAVPRRTAGASDARARVRGALKVGWAAESNGEVQRHWWLCDPAGDGGWGDRGATGAGRAADAWARARCWQGDGRAQGRAPPVSVLLPRHPWRAPAARRAGARRP